MKTYLFADKYSSATITLSAENEKEARKLLAEIVKNPEYFRMEELGDENEAEELFDNLDSN